MTARARLRRIGSRASSSSTARRVAERVLIAASMLGFGAAIAWVRTDVRELAGQLLDVPDGRFVRTIMAIGHPTEAERAPRLPSGQARLPADEVITWR